MNARTSGANTMWPVTKDQKWRRFIFLVRTEQWERIRRFRFSNRISDDSKAVRKLIDAGLAAFAAELTGDSIAEVYRGDLDVAHQEEAACFLREIAAIATGMATGITAAANIDWRIVAAEAKRLAKDLQEHNEFLRGLGAEADEH